MATYGIVQRDENNPHGSLRTFRTKRNEAVKVMETMKDREPDKVFVIRRLSTTHPKCDAACNAE